MTGMTQIKVSENDSPERRLDALLPYHYGIKLLALSAERGRWRLKTDRGYFRLQSLPYVDETYWHMIETLLGHLGNKGIGNLPSLVRTKQGALAFNGFHSRYMLWRDPAGKPCDWGNIRTWANLGQSLATLHAASRDLPVLDTFNQYLAIGRWSELWERNLDLLQAVKMACMEEAHPKQFEREWVRIHTYATTLLETAIQYLRAVGGDQTVQAQQPYGTIGQHELGWHSWDYGENGLCSLIDWEHTVLDIRVRDMAHMIHLAQGSQTQFAQYVRTFLDGYLSVTPLTEPEWALLYARLLLPNRLLSRVHQMYRKKVDIQTDETFDFPREIEVQRRREYHLRLLPRLIKETAGVTIPVVDWLSSDLA